MNDILISLLQKAYDDGIITSIIKTKILKAKDDLKLSDAEFQKLDDHIRLTTYLKKVEERKEKGDLYFGDLTKQYKITEEEKVLLQTKRADDPLPTPPITQELRTAEQEPVPPIIEEQQTVEPIPTLPITELQQTIEVQPISPIMDVQQIVEQEPIQPITQTSLFNEPETVPPIIEEQQIDEPKPVPPVKHAQQTAGVPVEKPGVVLIVDDNASHVLLTKTCLEKNGYVCVTAESAENAFTLAIQTKPSIILSDFNFGIGKRTGLDLFNDLKSKNINVPFIIISAYFQKEFVEFAFGMGVSDYLTKPFEPEILLLTVRQHLSAKQMS